MNEAGGGGTAMSLQGLTETQIETYREGYLVLDRFFDADVLGEVDRTINDLAGRAIASGDYAKILELEPESLDGKPVVRRVFSPFDQHDVFRKLGRYEHLLDCVQSLIGPDITLQHSK